MSLALLVAMRTGRTIGSDAHRCALWLRLIGAAGDEDSCLRLIEQRGEHATRPKKRLRSEDGTAVRVLEAVVLLLVDCKESEGGAQLGGSAQLASG